MITLLLPLLLAQAPAVSQVQICDKSVVPARCAPVTTAAPAASDPGINVRVVSQPAGGGGAAFSVVDEAAWTAGSSAMVPTGGVFNDSAAALTSGQQGQVRVTGNRGIHANLRTAAGVELGTAAAPLRTDPTGTTPEPVTQSGSWSMLQSGAWSVSLLAGSNVIGGVTQSGTWTVTGVFWQATQPVSAASLPLPSGASTEATLALIKAKTDNLDVALSTRTKPGDTQPVSAASLPLPSGAALEGGNLSTIAANEATAANQSTVIANQINGLQKTQVTNLPRTLSGAIRTDSSQTLQPVTDAQVIALLALIASGVQQVQVANFPAVPLLRPNPFVPRCNPVVRTNCQP